MLEKNIKQLTPLRFFCALWVFCFHYFVHNKKISFEISFLNKFLENGNLAVNFFFILSGFILTHTELLNASSNFVSFFTRRILRIYPIYILALLLCIVLKPWSIKLILINLFSLQTLISNSNLINPQSWSISQELIFYLLFFPLFYFFRNYKNLGFLILVLFPTLVYILNPVLFNLNFFYLPQYIWLIPSFTLGIYFRYLLENNVILGYFSKYGFFLLINCIVILILCIYKFNFNFFYGFIYVNLLFALIITIIACIKNDHFLIKFLTKSFLIFLGNISYAFYTFQHPIKLVSDFYFVSNPRIQFLFFFMFLMVVSCLSYLLIEQKILKKTYKRK
jgi:peptidoglycan/LPS O-acetylase OafA/YrhL